MIKIFDRYMAERFLKPFVFGLGVFSILIFLADMFDKMSRLVKSPASLFAILQFLWLEVPYWTIRVIPMATLLATLFAVTGFIQSGEWIAVQASGFESRAFFRPILVMAGLVTLFSFAAQETVLPACFARSQSLWRNSINPEWEWDTFQNVVLIGNPDQFITASRFTVGKGMMEAPVMDYYEDGRVSREIAATRGQWDVSASRWIFFNGDERRFNSDGIVSETAFAALTTDLRVAPKDLAPRTKNPDEMSIVETLQYLKQIGHQGGSIREARSALYSKLAFPFSNLILCALGIPIALKLGRSNRTVSFALALLVSFGYLWVSEIGQALGNSGLVHPAISAWTANLVFGIAAWRLYARDAALRG